VRFVLRYMAKGSRAMPIILPASSGEPRLLVLGELDVQKLAKTLKVRYLSGRFPAPYCHSEKDVSVVVPDATMNTYDRVDFLICLLIYLQNIHC
jgi:hypothetical protein